MFKGDVIGVQYGVKYYVIAASLMTISDMILAYSRFVDQEDRQLYIWSSYFCSLIFFALSAMADQACLHCFTRVIYNDVKLREGILKEANAGKDSAAKGTKKSAAPGGGKQALLDRLNKG